MGEKRNTKIIPFPTSFTSDTKRPTEKGVNSQMNAHEETTLLRLPTRPMQSPDLGIIIPTLDSLYDPDRITIAGMTVTQILEAARNLSNPNEAIKIEYRLEMDLFHVRRRALYEMSGSKASKIQPYLDLINHTLGVADELGELDAEDARDFRQKLRNEAIILARESLNNQARYVIEKHDLIAGAHKANSANHELQPPSTEQPKKPNPFTIVR